MENIWKDYTIIKWSCMITQIEQKGIWNSNKDKNKNTETKKDEWINFVI